MINLKPKKTKDSLQEEALKESLKHYRCSLSLSMGSGKTLLGLKYIESQFTDALSVLIVVPKRKIIDTWKEEADKYDKSYLKENIAFVTYISLPKVEDQYDIVIFDECHNLLDTHRDFLRRHKGAILGLSGTMPVHQNSEKGKIIQEFCPIVYSYSTDEAVEDEMLNKYKIVVHTLALGETKSFPVKQKSGQVFYTSEKANYQYWTSRVFNAHNPKEQQIMRVMRMRALMDYKTKEHYAKQLLNSIEEKVVIFANTQAQAERLCPYSVHSSNPKSEEYYRDFAEGKITKLSAVQQLNEGVNIPNLKQAIVMHSFSGSSPKTSQKLGRLLRLNKDEEGTLHILMYKDCIDEQWVSSMLLKFNPDNITYVDVK